MWAPGNKAREGQSGTGLSATGSLGLKKVSVCLSVSPCQSLCLSLSHTHTHPFSPCVGSTLLAIINPRLSELTSSQLLEQKRRLQTQRVLLAPGPLLCATGSGEDSGGPGSVLCSLPGPSAVPGAAAW